MYWLVLIVVSLIIAYVLQLVFKEKQVPGGYWNRLVGSLIGAWLGDFILGDWGWMLADYNIIAGVIGAFIIGWLYILLMSSRASQDISA